MERLNEREVAFARKADPADIGSLWREQTQAVVGQRGVGLLQCPNAQERTGHGNRYDRWPRFAQGGGPGTPGEPLQQCSHARDADNRKKEIAQERLVRVRA